MKMTTLKTKENFTVTGIFKILNLELNRLKQRFFLFISMCIAWKLIPKKKPIVLSIGFLCMLFFNFYGLVVPVESLRVVVVGFVVEGFVVVGSVVFVLFVLSVRCLS